MKKFNKIEALINSNPDLSRWTGGQSESAIAAAEYKLGLAFPDSYRYFLKRWGTLSFGSDEFYGIMAGGIDTPSIPNVVWFTLKKRIEVGLPKSLVVVMNNEGVEYYCLNTALTNLGNECEVVIWRTPESKVVRRKSTEFSVFLLDRIQSFLS